MNQTLMLQPSDPLEGFSDFCELSNQPNRIQETKQDLCPPQTAYINALPVELLLAIIEPLCLEWQAATYARPTRFGEDLLLAPLSPFSLASVCEWWMRVLLRVPSLWTRLVIQVDSNPSASLIPIRFFIAASRKLPLSVVITRKRGTFSHSDPHEARRVTSVMKLIRPNIQRCRALHIYVIQRSSLPKLGCDRLVRATQLEELTLFCARGREPDSSVCSIPLPRRKFRSPQLNFLHISVRDFLETRLRCSNWFHGVTKLSLANHRLRPDDFDIEGTLTLYHILENIRPCASNLTSLTLTHIECMLGLLEPRLSFPSLKEVAFKNIASDVVNHFFRVVEGDITSVTLSRCPVELALANIANSQSPVRCLVMEHFEDDRECDPVNFLEQWTGETLFFRNCPFLSDDLLDYMYNPVDTPTGRSFICPNLQRLGIMRCTDFSLDALKLFILTRREAVIAWYGDAKTEAQYTGDVDLPTSIRKLEYMGDGAPPLSKEDVKWFKEHVAEFGWGTEPVDIADF
ncbi:hypothetical protein BJ138DRAFT_185477 [Hygrophoropsis aurantiaca]|uniref:Uncharacterized protein n=1 Tax=Hygrophoropsis aurantiaca TaxID=72124 RepID=A0ACB8A9P9_9AGAM|nr:hypothetical protein BJ138DRAFT_185477 [Hygrophoropsis aurantiaca]